MFGSRLRQISTSYEHLATLQESGQTLLMTLEFFCKEGPGTSRPLAQKLLEKVRSGSTLNKAMEELAFPNIDVGLIRVAEASGQIPAASRLLAAYYNDRFRIQQSIRRSLLKPGLLLAASLFLRKLPDVFSEKISVWAYLMDTVGVLLLLAGVAYGVYTAFAAAAREPKMRDRLIEFASPIPWLGKFLENIAAERFFACITLCFRSGCDFSSTMELAETVSAHPKFRIAAARIRHDGKKTGVGEAFAQALAHDRDWVETIKVGEAAGGLEAAFRKISATLRERINQSISDFEDWMPKIAYGVIMIYCAFSIIGMYQRVSSLFVMPD